MNNEILVSVAKAILQDPTTGHVVAYGKANLSSAVTLTTQATEVRAGINNPLIYTYYHDRNLEVKVEQATFDKTIVALNSGQTVLSGTYEVMQEDCIMLTGGSGTLSQTPTSTDVSVQLPNGTWTYVTPTSTSIFVPGGGSQKITAIYSINTTVEQVVIDAYEPPSVVKLTLIAEVRDNTNAVVSYLQVIVPRFQISGNYTLNFAANDTSKPSIEGKALVVEAEDCTSDDYYAKFNWIPAAGTSVAVASIAAAPSMVEFSEASLPDTSQITVLGLRGSGYSNVTLTASSTYTKVAGGATSVSVNASTGLITCGSSGSDGDTATIDCMYFDTTSGSLHDYVLVEVTA